MAYVIGLQMNNFSLNAAFKMQQLVCRDSEWGWIGIPVIVLFGYELGRPKNKNIFVFCSPLSLISLHNVNRGRGPPDSVI